MGLILGMIAMSIAMFSLVFLIALALMKLLNPTASVEEIFQYWKKNWKEGS
jgi:hypothetical protein